MHFEETADLVHDIFKSARLVAVWRRKGVAVHRVRNPGDGQTSFRDLLDQAGQNIADFPRAHSADERQAARLVFWVELFCQRYRINSSRRRAQLNANRITHARKEVHVRSIELARTLPNP